MRSDLLSAPFRFLQHVEREARHGRACPADWTWIVPPAIETGEHVPHLRMLKEPVGAEEQTSLLAEQVSCKLHGKTSVS